MVFLHKSTDRGYHSYRHSDFFPQPRSYREPWDHQRTVEATRPFGCFFPHPWCRMSSVGVRMGRYELCLEQRHNYWFVLRIRRHHPDLHRHPSSERRPSNDPCFRILPPNGLFLGYVLVFRWFIVPNCHFLPPLVLPRRKWDLCNPLRNRHFTTSTFGGPGLDCWRDLGHSSGILHTFYDLWDGAFHYRLRIVVDALT